MVYKILLLVFPLSATAQSNQIKLYLQQIAANQAVITGIEKGIDIARTGLHIISSTKDAEFNLHRVFFDGLATVNPSIKNDFRVAAIRRMARLVTSKSIRFKNKIWEETADNLEELQKVLSHGRYQLTDDERMARINTLYEDMLDKFMFYKQFE